MLTKKSPSKARQSASSSKKASPASIKQKHIHPKKTRITVKYDVGFHNTLYIRGNGPNNLNWDHGIPLKNLKADEWVWETDAKFNNGEFKVLINDQTFEVGPNRALKHGIDMEFTPHF